jgi:Outer membrane lipoprotein-sorting protein
MFSLAPLLILVPVLFALTPIERLEKADRVRTDWEEAVITIRVTASKPGEAAASVKSARFEVSVKGRDRTRIRFLEPEDEGKALVMNGADTWLLFPKARPVKVPKSQRVSGGFAVSDVSRIRFAEDYDAVIERPDTLDGLECDVFRLNARKGRSPSFPIVRLWVDRKDSLYRKAVFLLSSGRTAREVTFDAYRKQDGKVVLAKMTIVDALRPGTTVVEYLAYERRKLPDALFEVLPGK